MKKVLVTGGAGYIGSVTVGELLAAGYAVTVVDNLSRGQRELVPKDAALRVGDVLDTAFLGRVFGEGRFDSVLHFASLKNAGESMTAPELYSANITAVINILNAMCRHQVRQLVFSSSAAVYGYPQSAVIDETHPTLPINYYGFTKLEAERIIGWYAILKGIRYVALRYFNVAGDAGLNYIDPAPANIFPLLAEVVYGQREKFTLFGTDYATPDGTCIRDYVDVTDIAHAHVLALKLDSNQAINLGTSRGCSVRELVQLFGEASRQKLNVAEDARRPGDPDTLVASYDLAQALLGWRPNRTLEDMITTTLAAYRTRF